MAERVPLPRPDVDGDPLDDWPPSRADCEETPPDWQPAPPRRTHFIPRPRENRSGQQPRFIPRQEPDGDGWVPGPDGYTAAFAPPPPATQWQPPAIDRPQSPAIDQPWHAQAIEPPSPAGAIERARSERAIIGDEIRIPILWCQFGQCIESYTHAQALGERDLRARAYEAGWRYDALWRLACPSCVQCDASFWASQTPVLFSRR